MNQHHRAALAFHQCADRRPGSSDDQVTFRKTEDDPGEPGVAEVALPCCRLLGISRLFGMPWLLIEICARSLGYGSVSGVFHGPLLATENDGRSSVATQRDMAWVGIEGLLHE